MANPSAVTGYNDSYADLLDYAGGSYAYLNASSGLITTLRLLQQHDGDGDDGGRRGRLSAGSVHPARPGRHADSPGDAGNTTPSPRAARRWRRWRRTRSTRNTDGTGAETTSYAYTWFSGTAQMQTETVSAAGRPRAVYDVTTTVFNAQGQPIWVKDPNGLLDYYGLRPGDRRAGHADPGREHGGHGRVHRSADRMEHGDAAAGRTW